MAKRTRKTTTITNKAAAKPKRRRPAARTARSKKGPGILATLFLPLFFMSGILFGLGFLGFMGYRTVTASEFFNIKKIDVRGTARASGADIERIVQAQTEPTGVWNADLNEAKAKIEKLPFVKSATVAKVLPDGVRVTIVERVPLAVVRLEAGDFWADEDGELLAPVGRSEERPPFALTGWNETLSEKARTDNQERVRIYQRMLVDWQRYHLASRVLEVSLADLSEPKAIIEDSDKPVWIDLGREDFGKNLQNAIEAVANKGETYAGVKRVGQKLILVPRQNS